MYRRSAISALVSPARPAWPRRAGGWSVRRGSPGLARGRCGSWATPSSRRPGGVGRRGGCAEQVELLDPRIRPRGPRSRRAPWPRRTPRPPGATTPPPPGAGRPGPAGTARPRRRRDGGLDAEPAQPHGEVAGGPGRRRRVGLLLEPAAADPFVGVPVSQGVPRGRPAPAGGAAARRAARRGPRPPRGDVVEPVGAGHQAVTRCGHSVASGMPMRPRTSSASSSAALQRPSRNRSRDRTAVCQWLQMGMSRSTVNGSDCSSTRSAAEPALLDVEVAEVGVAGRGELVQARAGRPRSGRAASRAPARPGRARSRPSGRRYGRAAVVRELGAMRSPSSASRRDGVLAAWKAR